MDFSTALPTFFITLREGVEAALVVGIVLALLKKAKQSRLNVWVYAGVGVGIIVSALIGILFSWGTQALSKAYPQYAGVIEPTLEGTFSVLAIAMLSWMLIWMTKQARFMKAQVEGAVTSALTQNGNAGWGIFSLIFIAVLREGFETVLFITGSFQQGFIPAIGALGGVITAVAIGVLLFKWGIKINIRQFFQVMGVLLVLIVAGLVVTALQRFDEAVASVALSSRASESLCFYYERFTKIHSCILGPMVWNTSKVLPDHEFPGIVLKTLFGYRENLYLVQAIGYVIFLLTIGGLYFRSLDSGSSQDAKKIPATPKTIRTAKD
ncbi:FTR1 family iron permease [Nostoc sp. CENA67]|uniref:FTR1 family iron permease n=1 Tax=Amazonocrinis nigriterrae CENA67 TaxID=2794033 RepID=A0A8J7HQ41_9NOST|nr:FTR1 family protein [Amazonocrinis nigriterrae]MBH8561302.1 FTR1 family iron permease [Amazonocrinis nigriterrae CENA67]